MPHTLLVMLGGAIGAALRYHVGALALRQFGPAFPWGTLAVNLAGGLLMGLLAGVLVRGSHGEPLRLFLGVGVLGGFTTFSAFSLEAYNMLARGAALQAVTYALVSAVGAILLIGLGVWMTRVPA